MRGELALLDLPATFLQAENESEQVGSPPVSPDKGKLTRVATFPPAWDLEMGFPKISNLKPSSAISDTDLSKNREAVLKSAEDFKLKLSKLVATLRGDAAPEVLSIIDPIDEVVKKAVTVRRCQSERIGFKMKKRVKFADDHGQDLVQVHVAKEPSDVPPVIKSESVLKLLSEQFATETTIGPKPTWCFDFPQPASEYLKFRKRLQCDNVVLENVFIQPTLKASENGLGKPRCRLIGTIRVNNVAFEKKVFVRISENNWISYSDRPAFYTCSSQMENFDTFTFDTEIPIDDDSHPRLAFCVGFNAGNDNVFWDNNETKNYVILSKRVMELWEVQPEESFYSPRPKKRTWPVPDCGPDPYLQSPDSWTDFSAATLDGCYY